MITSLFMTPFDVVKVRLQAQHKEFLKHKCYLYCNGLMEHVCYLRKDELHWFDRPGRYRGEHETLNIITSLQHMLQPYIYPLFTWWTIYVQNIYCFSHSTIFSTSVESTWWWLSVLCIFLCSSRHMGRIHEDLSKWRPSIVVVRSTAHISDGCAFNSAVLHFVRPHQAETWNHSSMLLIFQNQR